MIVDDELSILELYKILFNTIGFKVAGVARNGKEAVDMYKSFPNKPDVIIMDHRMPIMNGIEASKEILRFDKNAKIIFASADRTVQNEAASIGIISFKAKPFNIDKLINNIKKAVDLPIDSIY
ncbi:MAG: response regulator [Promethearchaeota archaeon]